MNSGTKKDEAFIEFCTNILEDARIIQQHNWRKIILIGDVNEESVGMTGYSYNSSGECLMVIPSTLNGLKKLHAAMKNENPTGRGWLTCMIRISNTGRVGADFEYNNPEHWSHTIDNGEERIKEFAEIPV